MVLRRFRSAYALAASVALVPILAGAPAYAIPGGAQPVVAQGSKPPSEVAVVPAPGQIVHPYDTVTAAGATGVLHQHDASHDQLWTRYDTGSTTVVPDLNGVNSIRYAGSGDTFYTTVQVPAHPAPGKVSVFDLATGVWQQWPVPAGAHFIAVYGSSTMLVTAVQGGVTGYQLVTFSPDGTATATRTVTGIPAGVTIPASIPLTTNGSSAVVAYFTTAAGVTTYTYALLDLASAVATAIPSSNGRPLTARMSGDELATLSSTEATVHVFSISGLVSGNALSSRDVKLPAAGYQVLLAGEHLIANSYNVASNEAPALDLPIAGGSGTQALPLAGNNGTTLAQGPDGTALVVGGSGIADWAVHRFSTAADGSLKDQRVFSQADPLTSAGLSLNHGLLHIVQSGSLQTTSPQYVVQDIRVTPDSTDGATPATNTTLALSDETCASGMRCVRVADGDTHGVAYLGTSGTGTIDVHVDKSNDTRITVPVPASGGRLVDASQDYVVVDASSNNTQYLISLQFPSAQALGPVTAAALWYQTLWTATATPGQVHQTDMSHATADRTLLTGAKCVPTELQTTGRWLYWSCGTGQPAGVYDLVAGGPVPAPTVTGPALLGDGYLVWHDFAAGALQMVDFHNLRGTPVDATTVIGPLPGSVAPTVVKLASLPAGPVADDRGITWTVDKFGGDVAYVAADQAVHLIDAGVPRSPVVMPEYTGWQTFPSPMTATYFNAVVWLSRPVSSWTVTVNRDLGGEQFVLASGGAARSTLQFAWNGTRPDGTPALVGTYTWRLNVVAADGGSMLATTQPTRVSCGRTNPRGYGCDGDAAILGVKAGATGEAHWYAQKNGEALQDNGASDSWPLGSSGSGTFDALVPFGDINGDYLSDLLARDGNGVLHAYLGRLGGLGYPTFNRASVQQLTIGTGWQGYTMVSNGDVNRDGTDDLLARDPSGNLWLYPNTGQAALGARVLIGSGWNIYTRLIGAGDLNGDRIGDLLAIDAAGMLWRYYGTSTGGYAPRVMVGSGWTIYNAVIGVGDLNLDGRADLLARDSAGNLWQYLGDGAGGFLPRTLHGYGFQMYAQIF